MSARPEPSATLVLLRDGDFEQSGPRHRLWSGEDGSRYERSD